MSILSKPQFDSRLPFRARSIQRARNGKHCDCLSSRQAYILLVARVKLWHLAILAPPAIAAGVWFMTHKSYRMTRMMSFRDPFANPIQTAVVR